LSASSSAVSGEPPSVAGEVGGVCEDAGMSESARVTLTARATKATPSAKPAHARSLNIVPPLFI
jgi:hypothetical protein